MKKHEAEKLIDTIKGFIEDTSVAAALGSQRLPIVDSKGKPRKDNGAAAFNPEAPANADLRHPDTLEWLYRQFRNRMIDDLRTDPIFLQLLAQQPELIVEIQPRVVTVDGSTLRGRVAKLIARGFFDSGKIQGEARSELGRTGSDPNSGSLSTLFGEFVNDGFLEKTAGGRFVKAAGLKVSERRLEA